MCDEQILNYNDSHSVRISVDTGYDSHKGKIKKRLDLQRVKQEKIWGGVPVWDTCVHVPMQSMEVGQESV